MTDENLSPPEIPRNCGNCACAELKTHPVVAGATQLFCRLETPQYARIRVTVPMMRRGELLVDREKRPRTEEVEQDAWLYKPTREDLVCFSGWRPFGSLPGALNDESLDKYMGLMKSLFGDMWPKSDVGELFTDPLPPGREDTRLEPTSDIPIRPVDDPPQEG